LRRYLIGIRVVVFYAALVAWIGFGAVFHLPNAVLLALPVGILELIPVIGPFASATIVGLIAIQQSGIWAAGFLFGFAIALRAVDRQRRRPHCARRGGANPSGRL
jgi:predicted PurR-regulated permease PerM